MALPPYLGRKLAENFERVGDYDQAKKVRQSLEHANHRYDNQLSHQFETVISRVSYAAGNVYSDNRQIEFIRRDQPPNLVARVSVLDSQNQEIIAEIPEDRILFDSVSLEQKLLGVSSELSPLSNFPPNEQDDIVRLINPDSNTRGGLSIQVENLPGQHFETVSALTIFDSR